MYICVHVYFDRLNKEKKIQLVVYSWFQLVVFFTRLIFIYLYLIILLNDRLFFLSNGTYDDVLVLL